MQCNYSETVLPQSLLAHRVFQQPVIYTLNRWLPIFTTTVLSQRCKYTPTSRTMHAVG